MTYTLRPGLTSSQAVVIDATGQIIGPESGELWAAYLAWLADGNTPNPAPAIPLPTLVAALNTACITACSIIVVQIAPDEPHQLSYLNLASMLTGGTTAPTNAPYADAFAASAEVFGMTTSTFATVVANCSAQMAFISAALGTLQAAAYTATTADQLATALSTFETSIGNVVTALNALPLPVPVVAPASISIVGINA